MKLLKRNLTQFTYEAYKEKHEILKDGKHTGKYEILYKNPVSYTGNISIPSQMASQQWFGIETNYTHVLLMDDPNADIKETGLIRWKGNTYIITAVRPSLNVLAVALKQTVQGDA